MPRDTRRRFDAEFNKAWPAMYKVFMQAIQDTKNSIPFDEFVQKIVQSDTQGVQNLISQEFLEPLRDAIAQDFKRGGDYFSTTLPPKHPATGNFFIVRFVGRHTRAEQWLAEQAGKLITDLADNQLGVIRNELVTGLFEGRNPRQTALNLVGRVGKGGRRVGGVIGLDLRWSRAVANYKTTLLDGNRSQSLIDRMVDRYTNKLLRARGERIARTETLKAMNAGKVEGMAQLIDSGKVEAKNVTKIWSSSGDKRVRDTHAAMDGQQKKTDEPFVSPNGAQLMHPLDSSLGAGADEIVQCRCHMRYKIDWLGGLN